MPLSEGEDDPPPITSSSGTLSQEEILSVIIGSSKSNNPPMNVSQRKHRESLFYKETDNGPFLVIIEAGNNLNIGKYGHLKIARDFFSLKVTDIKNIKVKGRNKIGVEFLNGTAANALVKNKTLKNKNYNIYIPFSCVTCKGIVKNIDPDISVEEITENLRSSARVLNVRRLNRKRVIDNEKVYTPTPTILITFEGISLPRNIEVYRLPFLVVPYISPVTQCYNCLLYGHTSTQCRSRTKCISCTEAHDRSIHCEKIKCMHCLSTEHKSIYRQCPEFLRQKEIKKLMSLENISYFDAAQLIPKANQSREYIHNNQDYPTLNPSINLLNDIPVSSRRTAHMQFLCKSKRTYSQVASNTPIKKKTPNKPFNFNDHLIRPNGRDPISSLNKLPASSSGVRKTSDPFTMDPTEKLPSIDTKLTETQNQSDQKSSETQFNKLSFIQNIIKSKDVTAKQAIHKAPDTQLSTNTNENTSMEH